MKQTEIEQAAKTYSDQERESEVRTSGFHDGMYSGRYFGFIAGAEMVNSRQPYTAEYMASFARFVKKRWTPIDTGGWVENDKKFYLPHNVKTDEQVIKLWEEQHNDR